MPLVNKLIRVFSIAALLLLARNSASYAQTVSFVQITDPHYFDAGKRLLPLAGHEEFLDNRQALDWAVLQTNRLQAAGKCLDFVAITGDFGLETVDLANIPAAAQEISKSLGTLAVHRLFLVPGNNDLKDEKPSDIPRFRAFVKALQVALPDHEVVDLSQTTQIVNGIRVLGLDSASFKNDGGKTRETNKSGQLTEVNRVAAEITPNLPHVIFTHIPDLEDPYRGPTGKDIHAAWQVDEAVASKWSSILASKEVVAVFAGHFHDSRRLVYMQDYTWATNRPDSVSGRKTWIAPPIAAKAQQSESVQARGLSIAFVSGDGSVSVSPIWLGDARTSTPALADKTASLLQGDEASRDHQWQQAAAAYKEALGSNDPAIRKAASLGFLKANQEMRSSWWREVSLRVVPAWLSNHWLDLLFSLVICAISYFTVRHFRRCAFPRDINPVIFPPSKFTTDAPADLFAAELLAAAQGDSEPDSLTTGLIHSRETNVTLLLPSTALQQTIDSAPEIRGVNLGKWATFVVAMFRYFSWRVESGIGLDKTDVVSIATLRWGPYTRMVWRVSGNTEGPLGVKLIAKKLAYNIKGLAHLKQ
jgi:3',5'-cyclic AMP phosphodiesterase CpdA